QAIVGCLIGTAVGDAIGLPCEGLSKQRQQRLYPNIARYHLLFGRGMVSDDTEHTCMVAQALLVSGGETRLFAASLARQLRFWLLGIPAGIGYATLRAILKLWLGFPPGKSGVFSAGNGPAMRSALLGICCGHDLDRLRELVRAATHITHTDPKAEYGALAVALAAYTASRQREAIDPAAYCQRLHALLGTEASELLELAAQAAESAQAGESVQDFAVKIGLDSGVSGYIYHTVPVVLQAWFRYPTDYRSGILEIVRCGGDTDTTAAILGGILGAAVGEDGIPPEWRDGLWEWPRTVAWMERLGQQSARAVPDGTPQRALPLPTISLFARNLLFLCVVLFHGFRRLLPPY
ncbi:MAG TPA: ADP-ribosylglycohydrolase family protein, partial [Chthonomonadaceae bacterium]|nr:ADP-ribosylglycohydrolase family protein [Chthonomonadaceae bacterium]